MLFSTLSAIVLFHISGSFGLNIPRQDNTTTTTPTSAIETPIPYQDGMVDNCIAFYDVSYGDSCQSVARDFGLSLTDFYAWNKGIHSTTCDNMWGGFWVCVSVGEPTPPTSPTPTPTSTPPDSPKPYPIQPGTVDYCKTYYKIVPGDICIEVANKNKITLEDFYVWNTDVGVGCSELVPGNYVCVGA